MADYLTENNVLLQNNYSSAYLYFSNFANKNSEFENALKASSDEQLNTAELTDDKHNKGNSYTRIVSASVMTSEMKTTTEGGRTAFSYQGTVERFEIKIEVNGDDRKYTAIGTDKDGNEFEKEIDPYNVDPTDADFTEFAALCSYIRETENLADETMKFVSSFEVDDIFERMNYLSTFSNELGNLELAGWDNLSLEGFLPQINKLMEALMGICSGYVFDVNLDEVQNNVDSKEEQLIENISTATQKAEAENEYIISRRGAIEEISEEGISKDREIIGLTTFPINENESYMVGAFLPPESTVEDPIVQVTMNDATGEKHTYNIHVNDVNPNNATEMEIFAYLTYQGHIGNRIPGAINNYAAYKTLKYQDELHENNNIAEYGNRLFTSAKMDATAIIKHVYSWMKTINHPDAQKQAGWCEDLLAMLNPVNDTLENYV
ncbi:hypothetical protein SAMN02910384_03354 [Pseudobutyrivibrio sp. ACV-2]|uniref:PepSY domain-containing protein n=1 Tax=Pseudobutyrivibrio sp. ACV-2 TaxID=1520801 RepID=UPI00089697DA|nr:PepSY domain-containing protein [Pseudobutyrivibrio sp. ACV-2]SEB07966.1 hypothetical protein SAMN02910384_03354 [Pseudobutyrivibrio sp. ACV-2]